MWGKKFGFQEKNKKKNCLNIPEILFKLQIFSVKFRTTTFSKEQNWSKPYISNMGEG